MYLSIILGLVSGVIYLRMMYQSQASNGLDHDQVVISMLAGMLFWASVIGVYIN